MQIDQRILDNLDEYLKILKQSRKILISKFIDIGKKEIMFPYCKFGLCSNIRQPKERFHFGYLWFPVIMKYLYDIALKNNLRPVDTERGFWWIESTTAKNFKLRYLTLTHAILTLENIKSEQSKTKKN